MPINIPRARYKQAGSYLCRPIISMYRENHRDYSRTLEKFRYLATIVLGFYTNNVASDSWLKLKTYVNQFPVFFTKIPRHLLQRIDKDFYYGGNATGKIGSERKFSVKM